MQRAFSRDSVRSNAGVGPRLRQNERESSLPLWGEVQATIGNEAAEALREGRATSGDELYLIDLLRAASETGHDLSAYLPWRASLSWNTFARAWYRVIWTERDRLGPAPTTGAALDLDTAATSSSSTDNVDAARLDGELGPFDFEDAAFEESAFSIDTPVLDALSFGVDGGLDGAATARSAGPNVNDAGDMDLWYTALRSSSGAGRPLDQEERSFLAQVFGRPMPDARLHEGGVARQAAGAINARAFTIGDEVWFAESPALDTPSGAELLAHEMTHVVQNSLGKGAQQTESVSSPGQPLEIEAENRGREARRAQAEWRVEAPGAVDPAGRYLVGRMEAQLPAEVTSAPPSLVREGLRQLLAGRAGASIADHAARLDELAASGGSASAVEVARGLLDSARAALAGTATLETLATLLRLGGAPTADELVSFAQGFAPYPDFAAQAAGLLSALPATADNAPAFQLGSVIDEDADHTALTRQLVTQLVASLHLPAGGVAVHTDAAAAEKVSALGTRGLAEGSDIYLDPAAYDPTSLDGRALLAHEVAHVAQADLPAFDAVNAGAFAEAEAHLAADTFAAGGAIAPLEMGLPTGHVAAEGDVSGADLKALLTQHKAMNEQRGGGFVPAVGSNSKPKADGTENHGKKVEQYQDGVDGIAGLIEDLPAFDDLCDACGDKDKEKIAAALARVKRSEPYSQLCQMWQGAKEGGQDEGAMKGSFEAEFNNRGFWGSTEEAFRQVRDGAKRDAKPNAAAAKAKADMAAAAGKTAPEVSKKEGDDKGATGGNAKTEGGGGGNADGSGGDLAGADVTQLAPRLHAFAELSDLGDDPLAQAVYERNHQMGLATGVASGQTEYGRTSQILGELGSGFAGSLIKGFTDQATDTLVLDTLGTLADKGLTLASKGAFKTPFVGPLIGLIQNNPLSDDYWTGLIGAQSGHEGKFVKGWDSFQSARDWSQFEGLSGSDWVGVLCAKLADFFGGLRDTLDGIAQLCGTLSAVSYVAGGILIAVGLALVWFFGVGAPLISIGGWLVRAGGILARINTALGMVVMALSLLTTVFRTAAAFLVPAELYAQQLAGVGDAASNYGEKVGAKVADNAANHLKDKAGTAYDHHKAKAATQDGNGQGDGKSQGDKTVKDIQEHNDALGKKKGELDDLNAEAKKTTDEDAKKAADADDAKKPGAFTKARALLKAGLKVALADVFAPVKGIKETVTGLRELTSHLDDRRTGAAEGARATHEALEAALQKRLGKAKEHAAELESTLKGLTESAERLKDDPESMARVKKLVDETEADLKKVQKDADKWDRAYAKYRSDRDKTKNADANEAQKKADEHEDPEAAKAARQKKQKELKALEKEKKNLDDAVRREKDELSDARKQQDADTKAKQEADGSLAKEKEHLQGFKKANDAKAEVDRLETQQKTLRAESEALKKKAEAIVKMTALEREIANLDRQLGNDRKQTGRQEGALGKFVGKEVGVDTGNGVVRGKVTAVSADGVTIEGPSGPVTVGFAQVDNKNLKQTGLKMAEVRAQIETKEGSKTAAELALKTDHAATEPGSAPLLRKEASAKLKQANELEPRIETTRKDATYNGSKEPESAHADRAGNLEAQAKKLQESTTRLADEVPRLEKSLAQHETEQKAKTQAVADTQAKVDELRKSQDLKTAELYTTTTGTMRAASSGNATGGVGSSWGDVFKGTWAKLSKAREISRLTAEGKKVDPEEVEAPSSSAGDALQKLTGIKQSSEEEAKKIGTKQAQLEQLMGLTLTVDIVAMMEAKEKAVEAAKVYSEKHAWAYACFHAEKQVGLLATETDTLAKRGEPVKKISAKQKPGLDKAKADESQRATKLSGAKGDVAKPDSGLAGIVIDLVKALSDHGDRFDTKPNAGDSNSGATAAKAQDTASTQAKDQKAASTGASDEQKAALETALQLRAKQESKIAGDITSLKQKAAEELVVKGEIQQLKAKALGEREAAKNETETNAARYNADYKTLTAWAAEYKARREKLGG